MALVKTLASLVNETLLLCGDPLGERFVSARVERKVNEAVLDFCLRTQLIKDTINIQLKADVIEYDVKVQVEADATQKSYGFPVRIGYDDDDSPAIRPTDMLLVDFTGYSRIDTIRPSLWYLSLSSPGMICILGKPTEDGSSTTDEDNLQVLYVAFPDYMSTGDSPDTSIQTSLHQAFPYGAAALLLEEGNKDDLALCEHYEGKYEWWIREANTETYRGETPYKGFEPL